MDNLSSPRIAIVGAGRAGASLGRALHAAGYMVATIWSRTPEWASRLALDIGARVAGTPAEAVCGADLALLAVVDAQIAPMSAAIASEAQGHPSVAVVHLSGASGAAILRPLAQAGYTIGAFHPLQTFADDRSPVLPGTAFAIEADDPLRRSLTTIARDLGGAPLYLTAGDRTIYHAAATITANYTVTLMDQAVGLLSECGLSRQEALSALLPLLRGAVENLARVGLPEALTGPIVRGDVATVAAHLATLEERAPATLPIYESLGVATVALAAARGADAADLAAIDTLLHNSGAQHR